MLSSLSDAKESETYANRFGLALHLLLLPPYKAPPRPIPMKAQPALALAALYIIVASGTFAEKNENSSPSPTPSMEARQRPEAPAPPSPVSPPVARIVAKKPAPNASAEAATAHSSSDAIDESIEEAKRAHIRPASAPVEIEPAPPPPHPEKQPASPAAGLVWVPGHWRPVNGEWQWTPGEWRIPATPISVWIEAEYDSATSHWRPGYWQPDRSQPYEMDAPQIDQSNRVKF